jgi:hypothetical protein
MRLGKLLDDLVTAANPACAEPVEMTRGPGVRDLHEWAILGSNQ